MRPSMMLGAVCVGAALSGCSFLGLSDDDEEFRNPPPASIFAEDPDRPNRRFSDLRGEGAADAEMMGLDDDLLRRPGPTEPTWRGRNDGFADSRDPFGEPEPFGMRDDFGEPPSFRDDRYAAGGASGFSSGTSSGAASAGLPTSYAPTAASARNFAAYLGFVSDRASAEQYLDWLWATQSRNLDGAQPYLAEEPDPNTGAPALHIYTLNVTSAQANAICDRLSASSTPCRAMAR